ncbi:MAG: AraC family transcriptional regulator [Comamonas sp.]|jgi:AraC-like DNA-binding protein|uniref:AraC family transcriptional regulator n=1 Tax=Comamonas sp. TaxID=34028 RepID=UPI002831F547|nr:AraC family transcriptional regulator [Comamonas sp.]MDR0216054.1 AraC family transcriptional regulator [Comamonas sp.]
MLTPSLVKTPLPHNASSILKSHPAITPMAFVQAIVRAYEERQMSPLAALEKAQIPPELLNHADECITALQMEALSDAAMRELDDEALGWFQRRLPWGSYGMLARASISAPQLGLALARWCRHHGLIASDIQLSLSEQAGIATLTLHECRSLGDMREFCLISVLRNIHGFASWLINEPIGLLQASFPFSAPPHASVYQVLFAPGSLEFDAPVASLQFDAHWLQAPLARDETALNRMLQRALPIQVRPYQREKTLVQRVRQLLTASTEEQQTAETLSRQLHLSQRSLHRQLKEEGVSLQALKDEIRRERAIALLLRTSRPIKRVAQACGFLNDKSFIRAFRLWTGLSPSEFRKTAGQRIS